MEGERGVNIFIGLDAVNRMPSAIVASRPFFSPSRSPWISAWCAQVTVVPEHSRISVLSSGKPNGSMTSMPLGGQRAADRASTAVREKRRAEKRPEPGDEEHHFRRDEQDHPVAQVKLDDRGVIARIAFADHVAPPAEHRRRTPTRPSQRRRTCRRGCRASTSRRRRSAPAPRSGR